MASSHKQFITLNRVIAPYLQYSIVNIRVFTKYSDFWQCHLLLPQEYSFNSLALGFINGPCRLVGNQKNNYLKK
jgi:hypothetical protein